MQDFFKYDKIQGGAPLFMKSDNDGSKDENKRGLPLGIKTTAQGIKHFTSWDSISNSIEARNTTRFDDAQPNSLRFSMNNARAAYDLVDGSNIYPVARPLEPEHGLLHRQFSKVSFEDRWEANDITILDDIAFVSYEDYSDVHRHDIDLKNQDGILRQASTFVDATNNQTIISSICLSTDFGRIDEIFPLGVQDTDNSPKAKLALDFASFDNTILKIKFTQTSSGGASFNDGVNAQADWIGGIGAIQEIPETIYLTYGGVLPNIAGSTSLPIGSPHLTATSSYKAPKLVNSIVNGGSIFRDVDGNNITKDKADKVVGKFYLVVGEDVGTNSNIPALDKVGIQLDIACDWGMLLNDNPLEPVAGDTTVTPDADGSTVGAWSIQGGAASRHAAVSHGVATPDDSEFVRNSVDQGGSAESLFLGLEDMPSDFADATTVSLTIREKCDASNPLSCGVRYQIFKSDGVTALTNQLEKRGTSGDFNTTFTDREYAFTLTGDTNKSSWDGALLKLEHFEADGDDTIYDVSEIELSLDYNQSFAQIGTTAEYETNKALHSFASDGHSLSGLKTYKIDTDTISLIKLQPVRKCGKVDIYTKKRGIIDSISGNTVASRAHKLNTNDIIEITGALFDGSSPSYADIHPVNGKKYIKKIDDDTFRIYDDQYFQKFTSTNNLKSTMGINWTCVSNTYGALGQSWDYYGSMFSPTGRNGYRSKSEATYDQTNTPTNYVTTKRIPGILGSEGNAGSINLIFDQASEDFAKAIDDNIPARFNGSSPFDDPKRGPQDFYPYYCANTDDQLVDGIDAHALKAKESGDNLYTRTPYIGSKFGCSLDFKYSHTSGSSKVYVLAIGERGSDLSVDLFGVEESECHIDTYTANNPDESDSFYKYGRVRNCNSVSTPYGTKLVQNFRRRVTPWHLPYGKSHVLSVTIDRYGRISDISHKNTLYGGGDSISNDTTNWSREFNFPDGDSTKTLSEFIETNPWKEFEKKYRSTYPVYDPITVTDALEPGAAIIKPNSDGLLTGTWSIGGGASSRHAAVSHGTDFPEDFQFIKNEMQEGDRNEFLFLGFENIPSDFATLTSVTGKVRQKMDDQDNTCQDGATYQIFQADGVTALTDKISLCVEDISSSSYRTDTLSFKMTGASGKTSWDGAQIKITHTGPGDGGDPDMFISEVELVIATKAPENPIVLLEPIDESASLLFQEPEYFIDLDSRYTSRYWLRAAVLHWYDQDIHGHHFNSIASRQSSFRSEATIPYYRKFNNTSYKPRLPASQIPGFEIYNPQQTDPITNRAVVLTDSSDPNSAFSRFGFTGVGGDISSPTYFEINRFRSNYDNNPSGPNYGPPEIGNAISHMSQWYLCPWVDSFGKSVSLKRVGDEFIVLCGSRVKSNAETSAGYLKIDNLDPTYENIPLQPSNNMSARYSGSLASIGTTETELGQVSANFLSQSSYKLLDFTEINSGGCSSSRYFGGSNFVLTSSDDPRHAPVKHRRLKSGSQAGFGMAEVISSAELSASKIVWKDDYIIWSEQRLFSNLSTIHFFTYSSSSSFVSKTELNKDFIDARGGRNRSQWLRGNSPALNTGDGFGVDFRYDNDLLVTNAMSTATEFGDSIASLIAGATISDDVGLYTDSVRVDFLELYERRSKGSGDDVSFDFVQRISPSLYSKDEKKYSRALLSQFKNSPQPSPGISSISIVPYLLNLNNINYHNTVDGSLTWNINLAGRYDVIDRKVVLKDPLEYSLFACNFRDNYDADSTTVSRNAFFLQPYLSFVEEATCKLKSEDSFVKYDYTSASSFTSSDLCGGHWAVNRDKSVTKTPVFFVDVPLSKLDTVDSLTITFNIDKQVGIFQRWNNTSQLPDDSVTNNSIAVPKVVIYKKDPRSMIMLNGPATTVDNGAIPPFSEGGIWSQIFRSDRNAPNAADSRYTPQHPGFFRGGAADLFFYASLPGDTPRVATRNWNNFNTNLDLYPFSNYYGGEKNLGEYFDLTYGAHGSAGIPAWIANDVLDYPFITSNNLPIALDKNTYKISDNDLRFQETYAELFNPVPNIDNAGEITGYTVNIPTSVVKKYLIDGSILKSSADNRSVFGSRPVGTSYPQIYNTDISSPGFDDVNKPTYDPNVGEINNTIAIGFVMTNITSYQFGSSVVSDDPGTFGALRVIDRVPATSKSATGGLTKYPYCAVNNIYTRSENTNAFEQVAACDFTMSSEISNLTFRINTRSASPKRYNNAFHKVAIFKYDEAIRPEIQQHINPDFKLTQVTTNLFGKSKYVPLSLGLSKTDDDRINYSAGSTVDSDYSYNNASAIQGTSPIIRFGDYSASSSISGLLPSAADNYVKNKGSYIRGLQVLNTENLFLNDSNHYMDINTGNSAYKISDSGSPIGAAFFNRNSLFGGFDITHQKIGTLNNSPDFVPLHIKAATIAEKDIKLFSKGSISASGINGVMPSGFSLSVSGNTQTVNLLSLRIGQRLPTLEAPLYMKSPDAQNLATLYTSVDQPNAEIFFFTKTPPVTGNIPLTFAPPTTGITPLYVTGPIGSSSLSTLYTRSFSHDANSVGLFSSGIGVTNTNSILFTSGIAHSNAQMPLVFAPETTSNIPLYVKSSLPISGQMPSGVSLLVGGSGTFNSDISLVMSSNRIGNKFIGHEDSISLLVSSETPTSKFIPLQTQGFIRTAASNTVSSILKRQTGLLDIGNATGIGEEEPITKDIGGSVDRSNSIIARDANPHAGNVLRFQQHQFTTMGVQRKTSVSITPPDQSSEIITYDPTAQAVKTAASTSNSNTAFYEDAANNFAWESTKVLNRVAYDANGTYLVNGSIKNNNVELAIYDINTDDTVSQSNILRFNPTALANQQSDYDDPLVDLRTQLHNRVVANSSTTYTTINNDYSNNNTSVAIYDLRLSDRNRCAVSMRVDLVYRSGDNFDLHKFDVVLVCNLNNFGKIVGPFAIDGYYPLYRTAEAAVAASPDPAAVRSERGETTAGYHVHTIDNVTYYMPNGLQMGATQFHGDYDGYTDPDQLVFESSNDYNWSIFDKGVVENFNTALIPNSKLPHETLSAGLNIHFDDEDLYFDKRENDDEIWKLSESDNYQTATQAISFADTPEYSSYLSNASYITEERSRTGFGYPLRIYDKDDSGTKLMAVGANYVDPYIRNTFTTAYIPNAIGAVYLFTRTAGSSTWIYHSAVYGKGYTSSNIASSLSNYNNGTARKEIRLFGYSFDYNDGRLAVSEPGGTGATVDDLNFANVDAGKAYLFDVVSTPNLVKTYSASGISLPTPSVTSQPRSVLVKGDAIGPYSNFGTNIILSSKTEPVTWSDGSISQTKHQGQYNDAGQFIKGATLFADDSTVYNLKTDQVFGFDFEKVDGIQTHSLTNLQEEVQPYIDNNPIADVRELPNSITNYSSRILYMRKLKFATVDRVGVLRMFEARPSRAPYVYNRGGYANYDDTLTIQKLSVIDLARQANTPLFIQGPTGFSSGNTIPLVTKSITSDSGLMPLSMGIGSVGAATGNFTLAIRHPMTMSEVPLYIGPSMIETIPLHIKANQNRIASGLPRLFIKNDNADKNLNLHLGTAFGRTTANLPHLFMSGVFNSGIIQESTLFIGEEYRTKTDVPLYLANDRLSIPYGWGDRGVDSALTSNVDYPSGLLTIPLKIGGASLTGVSAQPTLLLQGNVIDSGIIKSTLYTKTVIPTIGPFGGYAHSGDITLAVQGNNPASGFLNYNTLDPAPGPGIPLLIGSNTIHSGLAPLYLEHAFGGLSPLYIEGMVPASGLHTLQIEATSGNNANISLSIQSPTTGVIPMSVTGFRE